MVGDRTTGQVWGAFSGLAMIAESAGCLYFTPVDSARAKELEELLEQTHQQMRTNVRIASWHVEVGEGVRVSRGFHADFQRLSRFCMIL